jgi:hypothetical protein
MSVYDNIKHICFFVMPAGLLTSVDLLYFVLSQDYNTVRITWYSTLVQELEMNSAYQITLPQYQRLKFDYRRRCAISVCT